jgi:hypothetical protein
MIENKSWDKTKRLGGLRRFAVAITALNILGHTVFGFEQSWAQPMVALVVAYGTEILLEAVNAYCLRRPPQFICGWVGLIDFLLPAHISGLAVAMLLYTGDRLLPVAFAVTVAISSKLMFRAPVGKGVRHFFNPSNFGITITLLLFSKSVGIAAPYMFTENLDSIGDWLLPSVIILSGSFLNVRFTNRPPLILAWLVGFIIQAFIRSLMFEVSFVAALLPMTGMAFILYTFYMVTDPATTPSSKRAQVAFGLGVAFVYGALMLFHIVFGLFFALTIVCACRGLGLYALSWAANRNRESVKVQTTVATVVREA